MKTIITIIVATLAFAVQAKSPGNPSGPTDPTQDQKNTAVYKDTDGVCYSRLAHDFGKVVPCPKKMER